MSRQPGATYPLVPNEHKIKHFLLSSTSTRVIWIMIFIFVMHKTLPSAQCCHSGSYGMPISVGFFLCRRGHVDDTAADEGLAARALRHAEGEEHVPVLPFYPTSCSSSQWYWVAWSHKLEIGPTSPLAEQGRCHLTGWQWGCGNTEGYLLRLEVLLGAPLGLTDILRS